MISLEQLKTNWDNLSADEKEILGRPNFTCIRIAQRMREMGFNCNQKAEDEQAMVIYTMLEFHKQHKEQWADKMNEFLKPTPPKT